ncbi:MAG: ATP-dependent RecD-like DNA helicase [Lachnospiraceae bacterium]|nr:ATP-dependent RecD-like DNA helicase [Lachnospiraceae bacterium]
MQETVNGIIERIVFRNEENGYTVLSLNSKGKELTLVGFFQSVSEGESIEATGRYTSHISYGEQFKVESYETKEPEGKDAIERYLGSGAIKGIRKSLAARIVKKFGDDTLRILEEEPERLAEIKGISKGKARDIAKQVDSQRSQRAAMLFLQNYGVSLALGVKIFNKYGEKMYTVIRENPYALAEDIEGVGFKTADAIAARAGIERDSEYRIRSGILYCLGLALGEGNVYLPEWELVARTADLLGVADGDVERQITALMIDRKIVVRNHASQDERWDGMSANAFGMPAFEHLGSVPEGKNRIVYLARYYYMELNAARMLCDLNARVSADEDADIERRLMHVLASDKNKSVALDEDQKQAILCAARYGLFILTGGPGTGKTTTINQMLRFFESENLEIRLAAPTGRAAKRMTETTGYEASTIHRLLEISQATDEMGESVRFEKNEENPLEADVVIIDEMSMVDIFLMYSLLKAVPVGTRLVLVGDVDQLPSVGPGAVLRDMLKSGAFPSVRLTRIFRQAATSDIIVNAHKINSGEQIVLGNKSRDFFFLNRSDPNLIISNIIELVRDKLPGYVDARPFDIQVLSPMRKGSLGVERMNRILQEYLNPPAEGKAEKIFGDEKFRVGDKVMQVKNNYQIEWEIRTARHGIVVGHGQGIFNGDMGTIREINEFANILTIEFDEGRFVDYPFSNLEELELAYAVTIHKSQGSEYPAVILPLLSGPRMLFSRNLLYTAVTRARKCVMILGSEETVRGMIENVTQQVRYTSLDERICEIQDMGSLPMA